MSKHTTGTWQVEESVRRQQYLARIRDNTERYHARFAALLAELREQDLAKYVPSEVQRIETALDRVATLLRHDPEAAQALNMQLGEQLSGLPALARAARREFEYREQQRRKEQAELARQATSELERFMQELLAGIVDPVERDFAYDKLKAVQQEYAGRRVEPQQLARLKTDLQQRVDHIRAEAVQLAQQWKEGAARTAAREAQCSLIALHRADALADAAQNNAAANALLTRLDEIERSLDRPETTAPTVASAVAAAVAEANASVVDEHCRRATVRAIVLSLQQAGFSVATPQRPAGPVDEVIVVARKPSGAAADFRVSGDGGMSYKFDGYEGNTCKDDIAKVLPLLQEAYGIKLSDERVLWQNPDRLSDEHRPNDHGTQGHSHG